MQRKEIATLRRSPQVVLMLTTILIFLVTITPPSSSHTEYGMGSLTESGMEWLISTFERYEIGSGRWSEIGMEVINQVEKNEDLYVVLESAWENEEASIRAGVANAMGFLRAQKETSLPLLTEMLEDPDPYVRINAASAICYLREDNQVGVDVLLEALDNEEPEVRYEALTTLMILTGADISTNWDAAIPSLVTVLRNEERKVARLGAAALSYIGKPAVPYLIEVLDSGNNSAVAQAASALEYMEYPEGLEALPALIELLNNEDEELNFKIARAVASAGREEGQSATLILEQVLADGGSLDQYYAARRLGNIGSPASFTTPTLLAAWDTADDSFKTALAYALFRFDGPDAEKWKAELVILSSSDDGRTQDRAFSLLAEINDDDPATRAVS